MIEPTKLNIKREIKPCSKFIKESPRESVKKQLDMIVDHSNNENHEMNKLNLKMNTYVKQVKKLEQENHEYIDQIAEIKMSWGSQTKEIKEEYDEVMGGLRSQIDMVAHLKTIADVSHKRASYEHDEHRRQMEENQSITTMHTNKIKSLEQEVVQLGESHRCLLQATQAELELYERYKRNREESTIELSSLLDKLDDELFKRIGLEYNNQTLREQLEFTYQINQRELAEMSQLSQVIPYNEQVEFYKDQLKRVISVIRKDYDQMHFDQTNKMEEWMRTKKSELENIYTEKDPIHDLEINMYLENSGQLKQVFDNNLKEIEALKLDNEDKSKKLENIERLLNRQREKDNMNIETQQEDVKQLNKELNALTNDYNDINVNKATLEYEINVYKRLLDSQLKIKDDGPTNVMTFKDDRPLNVVSHSKRDKSPAIADSGDEARE